MLPSLCISHIFNSYLLVTAATLNICALDWWSPMIKRTCNHMMLTQLPCTTKLHSFFHVICCNMLIRNLTSSQVYCITSFVYHKDSLSGWTSSCWGRRAICLERFASGSHTADTLPMDTAPEKDKNRSMIILYVLNNNYIIRWLIKVSESL